MIIKIQRIIISMVVLQLLLSTHLHSAQQQRKTAKKFTFEQPAQQLVQKNKHFASQEELKLAAEITNNYNALMGLMQAKAAGKYKGAQDRFIYEKLSYWNAVERDTQKLRAILEKLDPIDLLRKCFAIYSDPSYMLNEVPGFFHNIRYINLPYTCEMILSQCLLLTILKTFPKLGIDQFQLLKNHPILQLTFKITIFFFNEFNEELKKLYGIDRENFDSSLRFKDMLDKAHQSIQQKSNTTKKR